MGSGVCQPKEKFCVIKKMVFFWIFNEKDFLWPVKNLLLMIFFRCYEIRDEHVDDFGASLCEFQKALRVLTVNFSG